jgi:regulatory factor X
VYCCYAEKCGTERVSVLNPASFGKLVRIIFPGVLTRRLGVRGESKYHYVDLTIKDQGPKSEMNGVEVAEKNVLNASKKDAGTVAAQDKRYLVLSALFCVV